MKYYTQKIWIILFFMILAICDAYTYANTLQSEISDNVIRLHIIANSDSKEDQELKLKVRDAILNFMKEKKYDNFNNSVQENVNAIRVVKSYVREDYEINKFKTASNNIYNDFVNAEKIVALNGPLMNFSMYLVSTIVCILGSIVCIRATTDNPLWGLSLDIGSLSSLLTYGIQALASLMMLSMIFVVVSISIAGMKRIVEVLKEDNINLHIKSGQTVGIIGGTGSSKTTLIQLISRIYDATSGSVKVGGVNVKDYDLEVLRNNVSVVLQKNLLFKGTIKDNLRWGNEFATDEDLVRAIKESGISRQLPPCGM